MFDEENKRNAEYYYRLFKRAYDFRSQRFGDYKELTAFYELDQNSLPSATKEKPWIYDINTPYATDAINLRVSSLQASDYVGLMEPLSPDDTDLIKQLNYAYRALWKEMDMDAHINESILRSAVAREAYTHVVVDPDKVTGGTNRKRTGTLDTYFLDPTSVHIDPQALSLSEADYICVTERTTLRRAKKRYPNAEFDLSNEQDRGEVYLGNDYNTDQDKVLTKITIYERIDSDEIEKTVLVGRTIVEPTTTLPIKMYPIAQLRWQKKIKSPYGTSLMDMLMPLQKVVNEIESANANANMQFSSPSIVLSEDAGIDPNDVAITAGAPGAVYTVASGVNIREAMAPLYQGRGVDQGLLESKRELERTIYKIAGISDQFLGDAGTAGNTSHGADLVMQRAQVGEQAFLVNLQEYVENLTRIVVAYIIEMFAGETLYVRGNKKSDDTYEFGTLEMPEPEQTENLDYTFSVNLEIKSKYSREQQRTMMRELFEVERQYGEGMKILNILDVLEQYDFSNKEELVKRAERIEQLDAEQRAQLIQEIVITSAQFGVDQQLVNTAISELLLNAPQTPNVDLLLQTIEQARAQMQQQAQQQAQMQIEQEQFLENEPILPSGAVAEAPEDAINVE